MKNLKLILVAVVSLITIYFFFGGGLEKKAASDMNKIENQVAEDAVKEYEITKGGKDKMEIYVHAGLVAAAYLQAKDEINYKKWKEIESEDGKAAGIPAQ